MSVELVEYDNTPFIVYRIWVMLSNGICGKQIIIDDIVTNYIITPNCDIYNIKTEYLLKPFINKDGYYSINIQLGNRGNYKTRRLHRLFALAYIPNPENKPVINHIDGNKINLDPSNLEWTTYSENNLHAFATGLKLPTKQDPETCNLTTHTVDEVRFVCDLLQRGVSPKRISKDYKFGYDFVQKIRRGITWTNISKDYDFPDIKRYSEVFTPDEMKKMNHYFSLGYSVREVIEAMNFEFNEHIRGNVKHQKKRYQLEQERKMTSLS